MSGGAKAGRKDVAMKRRYAELIYGEIQLLQSIFQKAIDRQYLKPLTDLQLMSQNFYFSISCSATREPLPKKTGKGSWMA